ncbi:uracil-DNA glycosylase family protein [Dyadobacter sp. 676]|uniref:Uracil-DNA glycosylase family protein n=1 Tax=Dyadobacter sp. 676 TaxID=3088362 RepID=A0AAU8FLI4_9BACT
MNNLRAFAEKYLDDHKQRRIILGINPSRFGAGVTGIPFTDTKRLVSECKIPYNGKPTHEISSVFIYEMINAFGGVSDFYSRFYINSPFPLAITKINSEGKEINYNYYDNATLMKAVQPFIVESMRQLIDLGIATDICFCLGTGKNARFLKQLNDDHGFFRKIIPLEHPRFIMQYKSSAKNQYIEKYIRALSTAEPEN